MTQEPWFPTFFFFKPKKKKQKKKTQNLNRKAIFIYEPVSLFVTGELQGVKAFST